MYNIDHNGVYAIYWTNVLTVVHMTSVGVMQLSKNTARLETFVATTLWRYLNTCGVTKQFPLGTMTFRTVNYYLISYFYSTFTYHCSKGYKLPKILSINLCVGRGRLVRTWNTKREPHLRSVSGVYWLDSGKEHSLLQSKTDQYDSQQRSFSDSEISIITPNNNNLIINPRFAVFVFNEML